MIIVNVQARRFNVNCRMIIFPTVSPKLWNIQLVSAFTCGLWNTVWCMKKNEIIFVLLLSTKHLGNGSCMVGRWSLFQWVCGCYHLLFALSPLSRHSASIAAMRWEVQLTAELPRIKLKYHESFTNTKVSWKTYLPWYRTPSSQDPLFPTGLPMA